MKIKIFVIGILLLFFLLIGLFLNLIDERIFVFNNFDSNFYLKNKNNHLKPKILEPRVWEINLSKNEIYFFENGKLKEAFPIAYQAPEGKWYQTPTGYFRVGIKKRVHISSISRVYMNYAVQMYEDFFIHEIPYYLNGERVSSDFTGGCIRLWPKIAKIFFEKVKPGDLIISYKDLDDFQVKEDFVFPVNKDEFYIRQRFNNPLRTAWFRNKDRSIDYIQHAGVDLAPNPDAKDLNVYNIYDGKIVKIVRNGESDHGMGHTVIVEINSDFKKVYVLYAHLSEINSNLKEGDFIKKGEIVGKVGATGYGCNYWRIGEDGCDKKSKLDIHLHLEIKEKPVLKSPKETACFLNGTFMNCYGYVPHNPTDYGYLDPLAFIGVWKKGLDKH